MYTYSAKRTKDIDKGSDRFKIIKTHFTWHRGIVTFLSIEINCISVRFLICILVTYANRTKHNVEGETLVESHSCSYFVISDELIEIFLVHTQLAAVY